ncbi:hypothetical protein ACLIJR_01820 [Hydrogenophaga sp. XSHU_21]
MNPLSRSHRSQSASGRAEVRNNPAPSRSDTPPRDAARPVRKVTFGRATEQPIAARPLARRARDPGRVEARSTRPEADSTPDTQDYDALVAWAKTEKPLAKAPAHKPVVGDLQGAQRPPVVRINSRQRAQPREKGAGPLPRETSARALPAKPIATRRHRSKSAHSDPVLEAIMGAKDDQALKAVLDGIDWTRSPVAPKGRDRSPS